MLTKRRVVSEKTEQAHILQLMRAIGGRVYTIGRPPRHDAVHKGTGQTPGLPDVLVHLPKAPLTEGRCDDEHMPAHQLWIEVKAERGRLSEAQRGFRDFCHMAGVPHVVGGLDVVMRYLATHGYINPDNVPHYRKG